MKTCWHEDSRDEVWRNGAGAGVPGNRSPAAKADTGAGHQYDSA
jgi:hypothetical protein